MSNNETQISVTVHGLHDGDQVFFRINRGSGSRCLRAEQTPNDLEIDEGDEIVYGNRAGAQWAANVETKPPSGGGCITLKVIGIDENVEFFTIMRSAQLKTLMDSYSENRSVDYYYSFIFTFNGRLLRGHQTPDELAMKDGDEIRALISPRRMPPC